MKNKGFNIAEILESVDSIVSNEGYNNYYKRKIIGTNKQFANKKIDMTFNRDAEKIIIDAEKVQDGKKLDRKYSEPLILNNQKKDDVFKEPLILNHSKEEETPSIKKNTLSPNFEKPLILLNEYKEKSAEYIEENDLDELEDENNIKELENNFVHGIQKLKSRNIQQDEKIKDLNILLEKFKSEKRYLDLEKVIKLYQDDNAILRKKIFRLEDTEASLRLNLVEVNQDASIKKVSSNQIENEELKKLNNQVSSLVEKNKSLESAIENLKKDKDTNFKDIENKIEFYREEHAKIIIDRSEVQKKLENVKNQLLINDQNKQELKLTLDKLNQILASSNIKTIF
jgi:hypothetical protein